MHSIPGNFRYVGTYSRSNAMYTHLLVDARCLGVQELSDSSTYVRFGIGLSRNWVVHDDHCVHGLSC